MRRALIAISIGLAGFVVALAPLSDAGAAGDPTVTISSDCGGPAFCFTPSVLTITDGDTVTWSNQSGTLHIVGRCDPASCDGESPGSGTDAGFTSGNVADGATFSHTFHGTGTYFYFCAIHGFAAMHGSIVVDAASPPPTATTVAPSTTVQSVTTAPASGSGTGSGSTPVSVAAATPTTAAGPQLAHTGSGTGGLLAAGIGALVLGLAAWGVCTPRRGVVPRLRR